MGYVRAVDVSGMSVVVVGGKSSNVVAKLLRWQGGKW